MTTGATGQLGLALPVQGELSGTWGDTVNNGLTQYINIAIAGTLTLTNDGAVTLANTTGDASASNVTSTLTGAGTVTAQFAIVRVTGTLTTAKVVTAPSYSKTYTVVNAATGGIVTFKAAGQTGVSVAVGESAFVYFNGTDYVKLAGTVAVASFQTSLSGLTPSTATTGAVTLAGTLGVASGGTGLTAGTSGGILGYTATGTLASSVALTANALVLGAGAGATPTPMASLGTTTTVLHGNASGAPTFGAVSLTADVTGTLPTANGGTNLTSFTSGGVVYASSTSALATGSALTFDGTKLSLGATSAVNNLLTLAAPSTTYTPQVAFQNTTNSQAEAFIGSGSNANNIWVTAGAEPTGDPDGSNWATARSTVAAIYRQRNANHIWFTNTGLTAGTAFTPTEAMRLTSTGLGIGTSSPAYKLDVNQAAVGFPGFRISGSNSPGMQIAETSGTVTSHFVNDSAGCYFGTTTSHPLVFRTANTERARIDSSGNVGIGTSSPAYKLDVRGTISSGLNYGGILAVYDTLTSSRVGYVSTDAQTTGNNDTNLAIVADQAGKGIKFFTNNSATLKAFLDSAGGLLLTGNLGIAGGAVPVASGFQNGIAVGTGGTIATRSASSDYRMRIGTNFNLDGTHTNTTTNPVSLITMDNGITTFSIGALGTAGNAISYTSAMTLDASGNLGVGTTSALSRIDARAASAVIGNYQTIQAFSTDTSAAVDLGGGIGLGGFYNSTQIAVFGNIVGRKENGTSGNYAGYLAFGTNAQATGVVERARIDSSGNLLIGQTTTGFANSRSFVLDKTAGAIYVSHESGDSSGNYYVGFGYNGSVIGTITQSGTTAVLYNTTSDQRLKENIVDAPEFGSVIDSIKVRSYDWKSDGSHQRAGFVAQELVTVAPEAVHQPTDTEEMMAVDYSKLVPMLVKEIQSLRQRLAVLEAK